MARRQSTREKDTVPAGDPERRLSGTIFLTYLLALFLFSALMYVVGLDGILAMTRLYGILQRGGFVPFGDADTAVGATAPELSNQVMAMDPIDWGLILISVGIFVLVWVLKSIQFNGVVRFTGAEGRLGERARLFLYGTGLNRWLPFRAGNTAIVDGLEDQGLSRDKATFVAYCTQVLDVIAILVFALISWLLFGAATWLGILFGPLVIVGMSYFLTRRSGRRGVTAFQAGKNVLRALAQRPGTLATMIALSLAVFVLEVLVAYFVSQAFTSVNVLLNLEWQLVLVGVLGAHIARLIPLTPGGLGQYEWGFVLAIYVAGGGFGAATTTALVTHALLYVTATLMMAGAIRGGVTTDLRRTLDRFRRATPEAQPAS
jgi:uncharacterized membrane protein YbhN (UPF0104 family)